MLPYLAFNGVDDGPNINATRRQGFAIDSHRRQHGGGFLNPQPFTRFSVGHPRIVDAHDIAKTFGQQVRQELRDLSLRPPRASLREGAACR